MTSLNALITREELPPTGDGPLSGRTVLVKDNICTEDVPTTCGSRMLEDHIPPYDATVVERIKTAGGTIVGKANMDEFGMGSTTETSAYGPTKNPHDHDRVPGGSSGGSAAAVANGDVDLALGTDTGGSIRNPAAFCGVVGLKPTYGLVSRYGLVAYANSLEQIGPITTSVEDAAVLLDVIAGPDPCDATTRAPADPPDYPGALAGGVDDLRIGVITNLTSDDPVVHDAFHDAITRLETAGATTQDVTLDAIDHALAAYYVIAMSEASSNLARYDGVRYGRAGGFDGNWNTVFARSRAAGFGDEVTRRILLGTYALSAGYHEKYYAKAQDARAWIKQAFDAVFADVDVLASPTMPIVAPELGERIQDPLDLYLMDANTVPVNLANLPAISIPAPDATGLPVGIQFIAPQFHEETLFRVGHTLDQST